MLITGYFMCEKSISLKKFLKLYMEMVFYSIVLNGIFWLSGYASPHWKDVLYTFFPVSGITSGYFGGAFLVFFLTIPFLNILVNNMTQRQHQALLALLIPVYTILPFFPKIAFAYNHVTWFGILYFISSYLRKYPNRYTENHRLWAGFAIAAFFAGLASILIPILFHGHGTYYFIADSNKFTALAASLCFFLAFKPVSPRLQPSTFNHSSTFNLQPSTFLARHSLLINTIASTTFGVLLIHANSDAMRRWLWQDVCQVKGFYLAHAATSPWLIVVHAIGCVLIIFTLCSLIDLLRQRFVEKPFFRYLERFGVK